MGKVVLALCCAVLCCEQITGNEHARAGGGSHNQGIMAAHSNHISEEEEGATMTEIIFLDYCLRWRPLHGNWYFRAVGFEEMFELRPLTIKAIESKVGCCSFTGQQNKQRQTHTHTHTLYFCDEGATGVRSDWSGTCVTTCLMGGRGEPSWGSRGAGRQEE